jgi:HSP20 family protein
MATQEQKDVKTRGRSEESERAMTRGTESTRRLARRDDFWDAGFDPFRMMRRMFDQFDRWPFASGFGLSGMPGGAGTETFWSPQVESFQKGDQFIVRADLPGLEKKDVNVEIRDDALVIEGERTQEKERSEEGYFSSERSYGRFRRVVPLPDGAIADSVKATFKNGVLEIAMQAPPHEVSRGRRIEIAEKS